jgi:hypothetical protein
MPFGPHDDFFHQGLQNDAEILRSWGKRRGILFA